MCACVRACVRACVCVMGCCVIGVIECSVGVMVSWVLWGVNVLSLWVL